MNKKISLILSLLFSCLFTSGKANTSELKKLSFDFMSSENSVNYLLEYSVDDDVYELRSEIKIQVNNNEIINQIFDLNYVSIEKSFSRTLLNDGSNIISISFFIGEIPYFNNSFTFEYNSAEFVELDNEVQNCKGKIERIDCGINSVRSYYENLNINSFPEIINRPFYYDIDLSEFSFDYESLIDLTNDNYSCRLLLYCEKSLFPRLTYKEFDSCFEIPLQIVVEDDHYGFRFNKMYFDEKTMMMSETSGDHFKKTTKLYLPYNEYENLKTINCKIVFENLGLSKFKKIHSFTYNSELNFVGDCETSAFCVTTRSEK